MLDLREQANNTYRKGGEIRQDVIQKAQTHVDLEDAFIMKGGCIWLR